MRSDGSGEVPAAREPVHGASLVAALLSRLDRFYAGVQLQPVHLAGGDGSVLALNDRMIGVAGIEPEGGRVAELELVIK